MQIYTVRKGDSLWELAQRYGTSAEALAAVNALLDPNVLVAGQALVIPAKAETHTVEPNECLSGIAGCYGSSLKELMEANKLVNPALAAAGTTLHIPAGAKPAIEVNGYVQPGTAGVQAAREHAESLTYLSPFSYTVTADGSLAGMDDDALIEAALQGGATPMMVVSNFKAPSFSTEIVSQLLNDAAARQRLVAGVLNTMRAKKYAALNVDFEYVRAEDKTKYESLLRALVNALHPYGYPVSSALAPKTGPQQQGLLYEGHDYAAQGAIVDFVILMTYEWGWFGGAPMAVAPLNEVAKVVRYAASVIPPRKILMGMPLYGYDWTLPYIQGQTTADTISPQEAVDRAARVGAEISYDEEAQSPYYYYYDDNKKRHVVWFEDARSVQAKYNLVKTFGLRGVSYWVLGPPFTPNWYVLNANFTIRKRPAPAAAISRG